MSEYPYDAPLCLDLVYAEVQRAYDAGIERRRHVAVKGVIYLIAAPLVLAICARDRNPLTLASVVATSGVAACIAVTQRMDRWEDVPAAGPLARYIDDVTRPEWHVKVVVNNMRADAADINTARLQRKARWTTYAGYALTAEVALVVLSRFLGKRPCS